MSSAYRVPERDVDGEKFTIHDQRIVWELPIGRANAITEADFARELGIPKQEFRHRMERLRRAGVPICSAVQEPAGVFLPATREEGMECYHSLRSRYVTQALNARAMRRTIMTMDQPPDAVPEKPLPTLFGDDYGLSLGLAPASPAVGR